MVNPELRSRALKTISEWEQRVPAEERQEVYLQFGVVFAHLLNGIDLPDSDAQVRQLLTFLSPARIAENSVQTDAEIIAALTEEAYSTIQEFVHHHLGKTKLGLKWLDVQDQAINKKSARRLAAYLIALDKKPKSRPRIYASIMNSSAKSQPDEKERRSIYLGYRQQFNHDHFRQLETAEPELYHLILTINSLVKAAFDNDVTQTTSFSSSQNSNSPKSDFSADTTATVDTDQPSGETENGWAGCIGQLIIIYFSLASCNWLTGSHLQFLNDFNMFLSRLIGSVGGK